jgi:hypothetical protein
MKTFNQFLEDKFMALREIGGHAITKDNCEDMFDSWLQSLDVQELIDWGSEYGEKCYLEGKEQVLEKMTPMIEDFKDLIKTNPLDLLGK